MKSFPLISIIFLVASFTYGQNLVVAADEFNIAIVGVDNPLSIAVGNVPAKLLIVRAKKGKITQIDGRYIYQSNEPGEDEVIVYKKENNKLREVGKKTISVHSFPSPEAFIGTIHCGKIQKKSLLAMGGIIARWNNSDIFMDATARIDSFSVCVNYHDSCAYRSTHNVGNRFSPETMALFGTLRNNDIVFIKDIYSTLPSLEKAILSPIYLTITDEKN